MITDARDEVMIKGDYRIVIGEREDHIRVELWFAQYNREPGMRIGTWQIEEITAETANQVDNARCMHIQFVELVRDSGGEPG